VLNKYGFQLTLQAHTVTIPTLPTPPKSLAKIQSGWISNDYANVLVLNVASPQAQPPQYTGCGYLELDSRT
jgi:hypothetical protein